MTALTRGAVREAVARAMCVAEGIDPDRVYSVLDASRPRLWQLYKRTSDAALAAIVEMAGGPLALTEAAEVIRYLGSHAIGEDGNQRLAALLRALAAEGEE